MRTESLKVTELPPVLVALAAQAVALLAMVPMAWIGAYLSWGALPGHLTVWTVGVIAAMLGARWGLPAWWWPLQLLLTPAIYWGLQLTVPPWLYLVAFLLCAVALGNSARDRVPLYMSSIGVWEAVAGLLPARPGVRFVDLGSGLGGGLKRLAARRPDTDLTGVENAPLLWLISRLRLRGCPNAKVLRSSIWDCSLAETDVVYAFLSPAPMARLWAKARREMRPGTLFVSNSFEVPGVEPDESIRIGDRRRSVLYAWRM